MKEEIIDIKLLQLETDVQSRVTITKSVVDEYANAMMVGVQFPPPDVFRSGGKYYLSDGFHRVMATKKIRIGTMKVRIHDGGFRDAILFAVGANATHGIRRTNADKRKAVTTLLTDNKWEAWSDCKIAEVCAVSQTFASKVRRELAQNGAEFHKIRKSRKGNNINTDHIGKGKSPDKQTLKTAAPTVEKEIMTDNTEQVKKGETALTKDNKNIAVMLIARQKEVGRKRATMHEIKGLKAKIEEIEEELEWQHEKNELQKLKIEVQLGRILTGIKKSTQTEIFTSKHEADDESDIKNGWVSRGIFKIRYDKSGKACEVKINELSQRYAS